MGVEAAVGPQGELAFGSGVADPAHRLPQEVGGAPGGVGPALAEPGQQHIAGAGGHGQQRVIATLPLAVMLAGSFLGPAIGLAIGGIQVDGQRSVARSATGGPGPRQQFPAHPVQLADMAPPEAAQGGGPSPCNPSASSMQSPPARADATRVMIL